MSARRLRTAWAVLVTTVVLAVLGLGSAAGASPAAPLTPVAPASASGSTSAGTDAASAALPERPVIFVHGYISGAWVWDNMRASMVADGFDPNLLFAWQYNTTTVSNAVIADNFGAYLDQVLAQTGATQVDVVSHSMGSLNTRWCMKFGSCAGKVHTWVSVAGANHGTTVGQFCYDTWAVITCYEMIPGSDFLATLNAAPEIPEGVRAFTLWTPADGVIVPYTSTLMDDATNVPVTPTLNHLSMLDDPGVAQQVIDMLAPPAVGSIAGAVTGEDTGAPLAGRTVQLLGDGGAVLASTLTDASGAYRFDDLAADSTVRLRFVGSAVYLPEYNGDAATLVEALPLAVPPGGTLTADAALTPRAWRSTIAGTVTDAVTGLPVADASVRAYLDGVFTKGVRTAVDGTYELARLDPAAGRWTVRVSAPGAQQVWWVDAAAPQAAATVTLAGGGVTTVDSRLTRLVDRPVLNGTVTSAGSGAPLAGIEVRAFQNGVAVAMTTTAADGAYAFGNLVPGTYTVRFSDPGGTWKLRWWTDGASAAQATPVVLAPQQSVTVSMALAPVS